MMQNLKVLRCVEVGGFRCHVFTNLPLVQSVSNLWLLAAIEREEINSNLGTWLILVMSFDVTLL